MDKLFYPRCEFEVAKVEAEKEIRDNLKDVDEYFPCVKVEVRMAWREDLGQVEGVIVPVMIPEAVLLLNGEPIRRDMLDFIIIDILALEMKILLRNGVFANGTSHAAQRSQPSQQDQR